MSHERFELAGGSVIGRDHRAVPKNNQDAYHIVQTPFGLVAVVSDGCGSGQFSEVGARLGSRLMAQSVAAEYAIRRDHSLMQWGRIKQDVLSPMHDLTRYFGGSYSEVINEYFLFTIVGMLLAGDTATLFAVGDGVVAVNGKAEQLGPFPNNEPPYLAYSLLGRPVDIEILGTYALDDLDSLLIGCDGVADLIEVAERNVPGKTDKPVGPLSQFWETNSMFTNPDALRRRLKIIGRDQPRVTVSEEGSVSKVTDPGLLPDDTTLVVARRKPEPKSVEET